MKLSVNSQVLKDALGKILGVVDKKSSRPILSYCLFKIENNKLQIIGTDLEVSTQVVLEISPSETCEFCINAKNIFEIVRELPSGQIDFTLTRERNVLELKMGKIKYSLLITGTEEFPHLQFLHVSNPLDLKTSEILEIINKTSHAISNDETRIYLNGIYLQEVNSKLRAVATDGHRLALIENIALDNSKDFLVNGIIIPRKGIFELKKLAESNPEEKIVLSMDESFLYVSAGDNYFLTVRLIARDYPKYQTVIPTKTTHSLKLEKDRFLESVKRIKILANEKSQGVKLSLEKDKLTISANNPSFGDAQENIEVQYDGAEMTLGFNAKFLIDTFSIIEGDEVDVEFNNELSPVLVKSARVPDFLGIVMPLKI